VQAQILNLMRKVQRQYGLSYLFISHDLSVVRYMADTIGVMYLGKLVEVGPAEHICTAPGHPYTADLISAVPAIGGTAAASTPPASTAPASTGPDGARHAPDAAGPGPAAEAAEPPSGCRFRTRCPIAADVCAEAEPPLRPLGASGQLVACHFPLTAPAPAGMADQHA
jgi:peptide/nickel transport system ATP-binding protein